MGPLNLSEDFATQLKQRLERLHLSQVELAARTELSEGRISQILRGDGNLTVRTMSRLAEAVGLKVRLTLDEAEAPSKAPVQEPELAAFIAACDPQGRGGDAEFRALWAARAQALAAKGEFEAAKVAQGWAERGRAQK